MTILDILTKAGLASAGIIALLEQVAVELPDLAPQLQELILKLEAAVAPEALVALAASLPAEIMNIAQGKIIPANHPSDAA